MREATGITSPRFASNVVAIELHKVVAMPGNWMLIVLVAAMGCSSTHDPSSGGHDAGHEDALEDVGTDAASDDTAIMSDTGTAADAPSGKPATPTITNVMPMAGAWHVTWAANDTALTKIELWRSNDGAAATLVKTFAGNAKDWHDAAAPGTTVKYCWTVKTFRGTEASDLSPEKCNK